MLYSVFFLLVPVANAAFSVHFAGNHDVQVADNHFRNTLKAEHVADLYARVSGKAPLLHEDKMDLPSANLLAAQHGDPAILELFGGNIEDVTSATEIARTDAVRGPALSGIHDILHQHNIKVPSKTVDLSAPDSARVAKEWLSAQTEPVFILHHDYVAAPRVTRRTTSDYTNSTGLTEEEINDYQIFLWTSVVFFLVLLSSVCMITSMDVIPDSILFAKFQSSRANKMD